MRRNRKSKIIATLGPASSEPSGIRDLFMAGADVFRLNFSHGSHADHRRRVQIIRELEQETARPIGILMDIQGPKLRLGRFAGGKCQWQQGQEVRFELNAEQGDEQHVPLPHAEVFEALQPGCALMIDDGRVRVQIVRAGEDFAQAVVVVGGTVSDHKGINVPGVVLPVSVITDKDREDLRCGLDLQVDWIAQSFVQGPGDVDELRAMVGDCAKIMVKLEKPSALERLDDILAVADGVMVARGDLGVELPPERVPVEQKKIIRRCRRAGKPVVVATHMLDSMVTNPAPTRAEASDVATAIYDGVDGVMLSAESAAGKFPVQSVHMMNSIIEQVERDPAYPALIDAQRPQPDSTTADAICHGLRRITHILSSAATVTYTASGATALRAARERPQAPILSLTPSLKSARFMSIAWGIHAVTVDVANEDADIHQVIDAAKDIAVREEFASSGQALVIAAGLPFGTSGTTNLIHVAWVD